ncbi:hypothetical protein C0J52_09097 [Blattella germanica]|nr:hypothetical protein C0J52_09097 [Blattella germanica]
MCRLLSSKSKSVLNLLHVNTVKSLYNNIKRTWQKYCYWVYFYFLFFFRIAPIIKIMYCIVNI